MGDSDHEEDFGFDSADEDAFDALTNDAVTGKRGIEHLADDVASTNKRQKHSNLALDILKSRFGKNNFRLKQEAVISRILSGQSAVVVFPTGGGKSLCYQIPAVAFREIDRLEGTRKPEDAGITLVISPLIALMKDQVDALLQHGIKAAVLDSTKARDEFIKVHEDLRTSKLDLLYCAPERLNNEGFLDTLRSIKGGIRLLAVDEAHCISEWGHSFRPDYLKISRFAREANVERVVCLTATATPAVAQDIRNAFSIPPAGLFVTSVYRPNLRLLAKQCPEEANQGPALVEFLKEHPGPSVVYVTKQEASVALATWLTRQKLPAKAYHAGLDKDVKARVQNEFMGSNSLIVACTIAFGMGIDKANIRNIVHFDLPSSIESYSQQIGRAGRDGQPSTCLLFVSNKDFHLKRMFVYGDSPSKYSLHTLFQDLQTPENMRLSSGDRLEINLAQQSKVVDIKPTQLGIIYAQLELEYSLFRAGTPLYSDYQYKVVNQAQISMDKSIAASAIQKNAKKQRVWTQVDIGGATWTAGLARSEIVRKLDYWNESNAVELQKKGVRNVFHLRRKLPVGKEAEEMIEKLHSEMGVKTKRGLERLQDVINLVTGKECFARRLAAYFGDTKNASSECGHCTWCETHEPVVIPKVETKKPDKIRVRAILKACGVRDDPQLLANFAFGVKSPRITALKIANSPAFESMTDCSFEELVEAFEKECHYDQVKC